jgi:hypothetical protein
MAPIATYNEAITGGRVSRSIARFYSDLMQRAMDDWQRKWLAGKRWPFQSNSYLLLVFPRLCPRTLISTGKLYWPSVTCELRMKRGLLIIYSNLHEINVNESVPVLYCSSSIIRRLPGEHYIQGMISNSSQFWSIHFFGDNLRDLRSCLVSCPGRSKRIAALCLPRMS